MSAGSYDFCSNRTLFAIADLVVRRWPPLRTSVWATSLNYPLKRFAALNAVLQRECIIFTSLHVRYAPTDTKDQYEDDQKYFPSLHRIDDLSQIGTGSEGT